jgi:hypothetical protein
MFALSILRENRGAPREVEGVKGRNKNFLRRRANLLRTPANC